MYVYTKISQRAKTFSERLNKYFKKKLKPIYAMKVQIQLALQIGY